MNPCSASVSAEISSSDDTASCSDERLEHEITLLAGHINAATYRLLCLIHEFDQRIAWGDWGIRSCAHWLNWKCGIALGAARQKVRVAHALAELPLISEAFRLGVVSYSKVRAMTRVATPENEDYLLYIARHGTASHVEKLVRHYRKTQKWEAEREVANWRHESRYLEHYYAEDGMLVIRAKLPPELGAVVVESLQAAYDTLTDEVRRKAKAEEEGDCGAGDAGDSVAAEVELSTEDGSAETSSQRYGASWDEVKHAHYRRYSLGVRPGERFSQRKADALVLMAETLMEAGARESSPGDRYQVVVHVDASALSRPESLESTENPQTERRERCEMAQGSWLAAETVRRIGCDSSVVKLTEGGDGTPLDIGRKSRAIPPAMRRALSARDGGCRFPACTHHRFVDGHHVEHWADGGETKLGNLVQLCRYHHGLVHEGGYGVQVTPAGDFLFTRPDGQTIETAPRLRTTACDNGQILMRMNERSGLEIDDETAVTLWDGVHMDYDMALGGLWQADRKRELRVDRARD